jgi:hypothetical protein
VNENLYAICCFVYLGLGIHFVTNFGIGGLPDEGNQRSEDEMADIAGNCLLSGSNMPASPSSFRFSHDMNQRERDSGISIGRIDDVQCVFRGEGSIRQRHSHQRGPMRDSDAEPRWRCYLLSDSRETTRLTVNVKLPQF